MTFDDPSNPPGEFKSWLRLWLEDPANRLPSQAIYATTAGRPTVRPLGYSIFDTTLGKPIWWNGTVWKDATGATV